MLGRIALTAAVVACLGTLGGAIQAAQAAAPRQFYGVVPWSTMAPSAASLTTLHSGGVGTVRFQFWWPEIETSQGSYHWSRYDALVGDAARARIHILPYLF